MDVQDLLYQEHSFDSAAPEAEFDPLAVDDLLREAQLLDMRVDLLAGCAGILLELRQAFGDWRGNTGLIVARGVHDASWFSSDPQTQLLAQWIVGSRMRSTSRLLRFEIEAGMMLGGGRLYLQARSFSFFAGEVPDLTEAPPDYTEHSRSTLRGLVADWSSPFQPLEMSHREGTVHSWCSAEQSE